MTTPPVTTRGRYTWRRLWPLVLLLVAALLTPAPAPAQEAPSELDTLLARFDHEPSVRDVQQRALEYAGVAELDLDVWTRRARLSNLMPRLQGQAAWLDQKDVQVRYRENFSTDDDGLVIADPSQNNVYDDSRIRSLYSLRVSLDLPGLLFDRSEPQIAREVRSRHQQREDALRRVTDLYFERRHRQILSLVVPAAQWERRLELEMQVRALTAQIDALTGGWFARELARTAEAPR